MADTTKAKKKATKAKAAPKKEASGKEKKLSQREEMWCEKYLANQMNGAATSRSMGYKDARVHAWRMLQKPHVQAYLASRLEDARMSADEVLQALAEIARADIGDIIKIDSDGKWRIDLEMAKRTGKSRMISKVEHTKYGVRVELYSKMDALKEMVRIHRLADDSEAGFQKGSGPPLEVNVIVHEPRTRGKKK